MKFVIDDKIPFIRGVLEPHGEVVYLPGAQINKSFIKNAECLLVRTRTTCNQELLAGTAIKFIGTATIGFDHIDTEWCTSNGITWTNAPGCNSGSVAQYVAAALVHFSVSNAFELTGKTMGIIGVGNVGRKVKKIGEILGMKILLNDPPRERAEGSEEFTELRRLLRESDIISVHVPLNRSGADKTLGLVNNEFLSILKPEALLINTSRGEVVVETELLAHLKRHPASQAILDVWDHEPQINLELLRRVCIATPHIAGYSADGKLNATRMIVHSACNFFGFSLSESSNNLMKIGGPPPVYNPKSFDYDIVNKAIITSYNILEDDQRLRNSPITFENQRNTYPERREFAAWSVDPFPADSSGNILDQLGFKRI